MIQQKLYKQDCLKYLIIFLFFCRKEGDRIILQGVTKECLSCLIF